MSDPSKVQMLSQAKQNGYKTYFYFIFTDSPDTNLARASLRVMDGGHHVPEQTILSRMPRTFNLMPDAFKLADSAYVIDNSIDARLILKKENDKISSYPPFPSIIKAKIEKLIS